MLWSLWCVLLAHAWFAQGSQLVTLLRVKDNSSLAYNNFLSYANTDSPANEPAGGGAGRGVNNWARADYAETNDAMPLVVTPVPGKNGTFTLKNTYYNKGYYLTLQEDSSNPGHKWLQSTASATQAQAAQFVFESTDLPVAFDDDNGEGTPIRLKDAISGTYVGIGPSPYWVSNGYALPATNAIWERAFNNFMSYSNTDAPSGMSAGGGAGPGVNNWVRANYPKNSNAMPLIVTPVPGKASTFTLKNTYYNKDYYLTFQEGLLQSTANATPDGAGPTQAAQFVFEPTDYPAGEDDDNGEGTPIRLKDAISGTYVGIGPSPYWVSNGYALPATNAIWERVNFTLPPQTGAAAARAPQVGFVAARAITTTAAPAAVCNRCVLNASQFYCWNDGHCYAHGSARGDAACEHENNCVATNGQDCDCTSCDDARCMPVADDDMPPVEYDDDGDDDDNPQCSGPCTCAAPPSIQVKAGAVATVVAGTVAAGAALSALPAVSNAANTIANGLIMRGQVLGLLGQMGGSTVGPMKKLTHGMHNFNFQFDLGGKTEACTGTGMVRTACSIGVEPVQLFGALLIEALVIVLIVIIVWWCVWQCRSTYYTSAAIERRKQRRRANPGVFDAVASRYSRVTDRVHGLGQAATDRVHGAEQAATDRVHGAEEAAAERVRGVEQAAADRVRGAEEAAAERVRGVEQAAADRVRGAEEAAADRVRGAEQAAAERVRGAEEAATGRVHGAEQAVESATDAAVATGKTQIVRNARGVRLTAADGAFDKRALAGEAAGAKARLQGRAQGAHGMLKSEEDQLKAQIQEREQGVENAMKRGEGQLKDQIRGQLSNGNLTGGSASGGSIQGGGGGIAPPLPMGGFNLRMVRRRVVAVRDTSKWLVSEYQNGDDKMHTSALNLCLWLLDKFYLPAVTAATFNIVAVCQLHSPGVYVLSFIAAIIVCVLAAAWLPLLWAVLGGTASVEADQEEAGAVTSAQGLFGRARAWLSCGTQKRASGSALRQPLLGDEEAGVAGGPAGDSSSTSGCARRWAAQLISGPLHQSSKLIREQAKSTWAVGAKSETEVRFSAVEFFLHRACLGVSIGFFANAESAQAVFAFIVGLVASATAAAARIGAARVQAQHMVSQTRKQAVTAKAQLAAAQAEAQRAKNEAHDAATNAEAEVRRIQNEAQSAVHDAEPDRAGIAVDAGVAAGAGGAAKGERSLRLTRAAEAAVGAAAGHRGRSFRNRDGTGSALQKRVTFRKREGHGSSFLETERHGSFHFDPEYTVAFPATAPLGIRYTDDDLRVLNVFGLAAARGVAVGDAIVAVNGVRVEGNKAAFLEQINMRSGAGRGMVLATDFHTPHVEDFEIGQHVGDTGGADAGAGEVIGIMAENGTEPPHHHGPGLVTIDTGAAGTLADNVAHLEEVVAAQRPAPTPMYTRWPRCRALLAAASAVTVADILEDHVVMGRVTTVLTYVAALVNTTRHPCDNPASGGCKAISDTTLALSALVLVVPLLITLRQVWRAHQDKKRKREAQAALEEAGTVTTRGSFLASFDNIAAGAGSVAGEETDQDAEVVEEVERIVERRAVNRRLTFRRRRAAAAAAAHEFVLEFPRNEQLGLRYAHNGLRVLAVHGHAAGCGVLRDDVIIAVDGVSVVTQEDFVRQLRYGPIVIHEAGSAYT
eukprot:g2598.t1